MKKSYAAIVAATLMCLSCGKGMRQEQRAAIDSLNSAAYSLRFSDLDSMEVLSRQALSLAGGFEQRALLNLAYASYQRMDYEGADSLLRRIAEGSNNAVTLLCADVIGMKTAQRTGDGVSFFRLKRLAEKRMARIEEERGDLGNDERLYVWAKSEYCIILSTYHYYQGDDSLARSAIEEVHAMQLSQSDLPQWLYYNYMVGSGGLTLDDDTRRRTLSEFDHLVITYSFARRLRCLYFEANALQALSLMCEHEGELLRQYRYDEYKMLDAQNMSWAEGDDLALAMAQHALYLFRSYGDLYQTACAYRSLGELHFGRGDYGESLQCFAQALHCVNRHHVTHYASADTLLLYDSLAVGGEREVKWLRDPGVLTAPELVAGIRQWLSLAYSALGDKSASDYNRNAYLDILQCANQNEELEDRNRELTQQARLTLLRLALALLALVAVLAVAFAYRRKLKRRNTALRLRLRRLESGEESTPEIDSLEEALAETEEALEASRHSLAANKRVNVENRAKVSLVHAIVPYLDRIRGEVARMMDGRSNESFGRRYIAELIDEIERHNGVLSQWIEMRQGDLSLHIATVPLARLFDIVAQGHYAFDQKGVTLRVLPTDAKVKADEALTLFMLNTLADNARKFTPRGGNVTLSATEGDGYVEVTVADTGQGLTPSQVQAINEGNAYTQLAQSQGDGEGKGFGFGLINCRGIIEKLRKRSSLFACCTLGVRSRQGHGATFFFRLPRVMVLCLALILPALATAHTPQELYDSVYQCNVEGRYADALSHGRSALRAIDARLTLRAASPDATPYELLAYEADVPLDYHLIMGLRNELALTALALNDWRLYQHNNRIYTQLQKHVNQDKTLPAYCERLDSFQHTGRLLLFLIAMLAAVAHLLVYSLLIGTQLTGEKDAAESIRLLLSAKQSRLSQDLASKRDALAKSLYEERRVHVQNQILDNCLSTIKHESLYYPARIRHLATHAEPGADLPQLAELSGFYRNVYGMLCSLADQQLASPGFKRQNISADRVASLAQSSLARLSRRLPQQATLTVRTEQATVCADEHLLSLFFDKALPRLIGTPASVSLEARRQGRFMLFTLSCASAPPLEGDAQSLFAPSPEAIPMLVAKQVIREHDIYSGHPGLRLYATPLNPGVAISFTLLTAWLG